MAPSGPDADELAALALDWLIDHARGDGDRMGWPNHPGDDELDPTLYSGAAGIVVTLVEAYHHYGDDRFADAALAGARGLAADVQHDRLGQSSLYFGLAGHAVALHAVATHLRDSDAGTASRTALRMIGNRFDGERWGEQFELLGGNAGIALGALATDDLDLAVLAVEPYLRTWDETPAGRNWEVRAGTPARFHHVSHGTLGIVHALAAVGAAAGRDELIELAVRGAHDVVSRNDGGPDDFLVPHSDPQHRPDRIERYSFGWCHGPTGDAQTFRLLARLTGDRAWTDLAERCWHTVVTSGLPERIRPGFWDNSGRCCGTAGVLALADDRSVEGLDAAQFADTLVADLAARATVDGAGARWSNVEHRADPPELAPRIGWAMGNAGIARELMRHVRIRDGRDGSYAVPWPDHPPVIART